MNSTNNSTLEDFYEDLDKKIAEDPVAQDYKKYQEAIDTIYLRWKTHTKFLEDMPEDQARTVSVILENQRLMNESGSGTEPFRKHSISILAKTFKNFLPFEMVSVQPMLGPKIDNFYLAFVYKSKNPAPTLSTTDETTLMGYMDPDAKVDPDNLPEISLAMKTIETSAKTKRTRLRWVGGDGGNDYENEDFRDTLAEEFRNEITREIMTDLRNNAGTVATSVLIDDVYDHEAIYIKMVEVSSVIHRKTLRGGCNWIVTSPEIGMVMAKANGWNTDFKFGIGGNVIKVGVLNGRWKLFVDPLFPANNMLLGYKEPHMLDNGYVYCPYVALTETPIILDPEEFKPQRGYLTRYGKRLISPKPYARMNFMKGSEVTS